MVRFLSSTLREFEDDKRVKVVVINGAGDRGLCAGGDIRAILDSVMCEDGLAANFWRQEYSLNAQIARYSKPYIAIMDGLVFGGGVGVACHGSHRIATERLRLAMPEVSIGFIPDIGGSWLLSRAPGELGTYLALTGAMIGAHDAQYARLANSIVAAANVPTVIAALCEAKYGGDAAKEADAVIRAHLMDPSTSSLQRHQLQIDSAFGFRSVEEIVASLRASSDEFLRAAAVRIASNSPTSLKVALRSLRNARGYQSLEECLAMEFRVALRIARSNDFIEGVRAVIDKNGAPRWVPAALREVSEKDVDDFFSPLGDGELWVAAVN